MAGEALHKAQAGTRSRHAVTTLGEMTAPSLHEIISPLAAVVTNGSACLRW